MAHLDKQPCVCELEMDLARNRDTELQQRGMYFTSTFTCTRQGGGNNSCLALGYLWYTAQGKDEKR